MWYQLKISHCREAEVEELSQLLEDQGALSVTLLDNQDHPILEPAPGTVPLWPEVILVALYAEAEPAEQAREQIQRLNQQLSCEIELLPDQDWETVWKSDFKPQSFGKRLWICPSWHTPPEPDAVNLILDPGLAFGTGTHPTTALCLRWLDQAELSQQTVIDFGCGSGILALAALKLGAALVYAVDIDPQALEATANNAELNQINRDQLAISQPEALDSPVDLIVANILLRPLLDLKSRLLSLLKPAGRLVVSGILVEQIEQLSQHYQPEMRVGSSQIEGDWALIEFIRADDHE